MNTVLHLLLENEAIDDRIEEFCNSDPEYLKAKQQFYEAQEELVKRIGLDLYDAFERSFGAYLYRTADLYYLFGLGFRQEVLQAIGG